MKQVNKPTKEEAVTIAKNIVSPTKNVYSRKKYILPNKIDYSKPTSQQLQAFNNILTLVSQGMPRYRAIDEVNQMSRSCFTNLLEFNEELKKSYARATEEREVVMFDKALEVAYDDSNDFYTNDKGNLVPNPVAVQRSRLITDTILKMLATMNHKKYGNKTTVSGDADNPILIQPILGMIVE